MRIFHDKSPLNRTKQESDPDMGNKRTKHESKYDEAAIMLGLYVGRRQSPGDMRPENALAVEVLVEGQIKIIHPQHFTPGLVLPQRPLRIVIRQRGNPLHQQVWIPATGRKAPVLVLERKVHQQHHRHRSIRPGLRRADDPGKFHQEPLFIDELKASDLRWRHPWPVVGAERVGGEAFAIEQIA